MTDQPCHVADYAFSTGRDVAWRDVEPVGWAYETGNGWTARTHDVPDLSDPRWRADVQDGLVAQGFNFTLGVWMGDPMAVLTKRLTEPVVQYRSLGPDLPSALCAAIAKAREAP